MEKLISYSTENCIICSEFMGAFRNELTVVTGYSEKQIYELIECFTNINFTSEIIEEAGICQNCFIKFNEYDEHKSIAEQIESDLLSLFIASTEAGFHLKTEVKIEEDEAFNEVVYQSVEEVQHEPIEEMFIGGPDEEDFNADSSQIIVEYNWLEEQNSAIKVDEEMSQQAQPNPKQPRSRTTGPDENLTVMKLEDSQRMYQCETCLRAFKEKSKLKSHREIHTTERNVICPTCGKAFKTQACLRSHRRVHNPTYMFCDICGKAYTQKPELAKHIKFVHFHIREFFCESCGAGFGSKGHLATHKLTHQDSSVKSVVCQVCSSAFHTKAKLDRHMKSHTGERNYECGICQKRFLYSYNVTAHIKHVHYREKRKDNERCCSFCGRRFQKLWKLREHMADAHHVVESSVDDGSYYIEETTI